MFFTILFAEVVPLIVKVEQIRKFPLRVNPAIGDLKFLPSFFMGVVSLVVIGDDYAGETFRDAPVYPHVAVGSGLAYTMNAVKMLL